MLKRRNFIKTTCSAGILSIINYHFGAFQPGSAGPAKTGNAGRITALRLQTVCSLHELKEFYTGKIGFPIDKESEDELTFIAGDTTLTFIRVSGENERPFYHFAFNIPENKIELAFEWQKKKTPIVHPNAAGPVNEIVNFAHWNAHSVFFLDPAGNLVEYIARHDLKNAAEGEFSVKDILYASEIAFIVDDAITSGNALQKALNISAYRPASPGFWPIGDESGLLLVIEKGKQWSSLPGQVNKTTVFKTSVTIRNNKKGGWSFPGYPYELKIQ